MTSQPPACPQCNRKIMQSVSNRCMYCGVDLPEEHHLTAEQKQQLLHEKMAMFRRNEENAEALISSMRENFGLPAPKPRKKSRKEKRADKSQAVDDALADIQNHLEQLRRQRNSPSDGDN